MTHQHSESALAPDLVIWQGGQSADDALHELDAIFTGEHGAVAVGLLCVMARGALANKPSAEIASAHPTPESTIALRAIKRVLSVSNQGESLYATPTVWSTMKSDEDLSQLAQEVTLTRKPKYPTKQRQIDEAQARWQAAITFVKLAAYGISLRATPPEKRPQRPAPFSPSSWQGRPESGLGSW